MLISIFLTQPFLHIKQATQWVNLFLSLGGIEDGYKKVNITPYIHILCYHVPKFLSTCGVKCFTGQGVEKTNDDIRRRYHLKSNKHDACKDALQTVKRLDELQEFDRKRRSYTQHDAAYWSEGIMENRRKQPRLSVVPREDTGINVDKLDQVELKAKLKEMNVNTRIRSVDKLRQLLKDVLYAAS